MPTNRSQDMIRKVAYAGVCAVFVLIATQIKIPTAIGYVNLGDPVILLSAYLFGPYAFFAAAIGSALGDLLAGFPQYIIPTFIIKGLMGFVAGLILRKAKQEKKTSRVPVIVRLPVFLLSEAIMVIGYFGFEALPFMYGLQAAAASVLFNLIQALVAVSVAMPISYVAFFEKESFLFKSSKKSQN